MAVNPILQQMGRLAMGNNPVLNTLSQIKNMARANPAAYANMLAQKNPQFAQFMRENQGLNATQIAQKYGIDPSKLGDLLR